MEKIIEKLKKHPIAINYVIIFFIALMVCIPLFYNRTQFLKDDGVYHVYRLIGTQNSLKENFLFPQIMSEFCNGFGYSCNIFYSPLTAYVPLILKLITNSYFLILKVFEVILMLFSGIFMHKLVLKISKSKLAAFISATLYIIAPYHITDVYARCALAEQASFVFLPLVFIGMYDIFEDNKKQSYYLAIGAIGLLLSHTVITMYTAIFCFVYCLIHIKQFKNKEIWKKLFLNFAIILLVTSFFLIPLMEHYFATSYEVFVEGRMYSDEQLIESRLTFSELMYKNKHYMIMYIGLENIAGIILFIIALLKKKLENKKIMITLFCFGIASMIMSSKLFPFQYLPNIFKMIQFAWRMSEFSAFFLSIISGILISQLLKTVKYDTFLVVTTITIIALSASTSIIRTWVTTKYEIDEEQFLQPKRIMEGDRMHASFEYLPTKACNNLPYIMTREEGIIVLDGKANITDFAKENGVCTANIVECEPNTIIELPYIYYLGYEINLINNDKKQRISYTESDKGFIEAKLPEDINNNTKIEVKYSGTLLTKVSYITTLIGIIVLGIYCYKERKNS